MTAADRSEGARLHMVQGQLVTRGISDPRVLAAMREVPRHEFVLPRDEHRAYDDNAMPIGHGQTISQPYMVAYMLQQLQVEPEHRALEVGAGSGYQAALLGRLAREVYAIEICEPLAQRARETVVRLGYRNVHIIAGDGGPGYSPAAPFDRIIVAAACPQIPPPLIEQLADGGRLVAPVGSQFAAQCIVGEKQGETFTVSDTIGCIFVPLTGQFGWE